MEILNKNNQKVFQKSYSKSEIIDKKEKFNVLGFLTDLVLFGTPEFDSNFVIFGKSKR